MRHYVELYRPNAAPERHALERDLLWLGSAAQGSFQEREMAAGKRYEAELVPDARGVRVEVAPGSTLSLRVAGVATASALVHWGEAALLGNIELHFVEARQRARQGLVWLLPLAVMALGGALLVVNPSPQTAEPPALTLPELPVGPVDCSAQGAGTEPRAFEAERLGTAKRERYPFDGKDGVEALPLLLEAASCFRDAGRLQDGQRAQAAAAELEERIDADRAALRLASRAALLAGRDQDALRSLRKLQALVGSAGSSPYADWLVGRQRELEANIGAAHKSATH